MEASSSSQSRNAKTAVLQNLLTDNGAKPSSDTTDNDADSAAKPAGTSLDDRHSAAKTVETVTLRVVSALSAEHMFGPLRIQRTEEVSWLVRQLQHLSFSDNPHGIGKQPPPGLLSSQLARPPLPFAWAPPSLVLSHSQIAPHPRPPPNLGQLPNVSAASPNVLNSPLARPTPTTTRERPCAQLIICLFYVMCTSA